MLCNDVLCNISLLKSTFKDTTKLAMMEWYLYTVIVAEVIVKLCLALWRPPLTVAHQAPLTMGFPKQEYWSGLPFPSPVDLPNLHLLHWQRSNPHLLHWQVDSLPLSHQESMLQVYKQQILQVRAWLLVLLIMYS